MVNAHYHLPFRGEVLTVWDVLGRALVERPRDLVSQAFVWDKGSMSTARSGGASRPPSRWPALTSARRSAW
jgi:hypothetical protein